MSEVAGRQEESGWAGESQLRGRWGMLLPGSRMLRWSCWRSPPRVLIHPASFSLGPLPGLDEVLSCTPCSFPVVCRVLCAFISREQRPRGLSRLKPPWCFIFSLLSPSISQKRTVLWLKGLLFVKPSRPHDSALWPFSPHPRLSRGWEGTRLRDRTGLGGDWGRDGAGHCSCPDAFPGARPPASCSCCRVCDI